MTEFFSKYVDLTALILTVLLPLFLTIRVKRKAGKHVRAVPTYFLLFGPAGILTFIFFHLFENSYHAIENSLNGTFVYNFRFYSLILLGIVMGHLGLQLMKSCIGKCLQADFQNKRYFFNLFLVLLFAAPLIPIIPIAYVPIFLSGISLMGFPFINRKIRTNDSTFSEEPRTWKPEPSALVQ